LIETITRFRRSARIVCLCFLVFFAISCTDYRTRRDINSFFREVAQGGPSRSYDLRSVIPDEWEKVCIGYFPYENQKHIEKKFGGKVRGNFKIVVNKSDWMFLGINAENEITQVVLDREISTFLFNNFRGVAAWGGSCVSRDQAVLIWLTHNGKPYLKLGDL
jgi:hypothetical protein